MIARNNPTRFFREENYGYPQCSFARATGVLLALNAATGATAGLSSSVRARLSRESTAGQASSGTRQNSSVGPRFRRHDHSTAKIAGATCSLADGRVAPASGTQTCCQSTASINTLIPEPMPSIATWSSFGQMPVFDAQRHRQRQGHRAGVAQHFDRGEIDRRLQAERFEHQLAMGHADLVAKRLVDFGGRPVRFVQEFGERFARRCGFLRSISRSESVSISGRMSPATDSSRPLWHRP